MTQKKNVLFIMFDQLRFDYLSCQGHPHLHTPHMDRLAEKGVRFTRAYVQSPICGSSRMSYYTGRYVHSHGAQRNNFPLKVGEFTLGDHLRNGDIDCYLIGKTHMQADEAGLKRLGIMPDSVIGARQSECGFDAYIRDDGLWAEGVGGLYDSKRSPYNEYLKDKGYEAHNPWHENANSALNEEGDIASGWLMQNADQPANIKEEDSETPWLTSQAIQFMEERREADKSWLCHLSYIKPHWPYIVPAPYHDMYGPEHILPVQRSNQEKAHPHPVYGAYMENLVAQSFSKDEVREKVIPAYMGLIKQCDDQMGRLFTYLEETGQMDNTMIVITSDHGDYLGDHWLGEKDLFHECSVKVPLIIYDPSADTDGTRGTVCDELVEAIDLVPTFLEWFGQDIPNHIVEGRSLMPFLRGEQVDDWRDFVISEYDYSTTLAAEKLGLEPADCRLFMVADKDWKLVHAEGDMRPMLFNLNDDPEEYYDLGDSAAHYPVREQMYRHLGAWARRMSQRTAISDDRIKMMRGKALEKGIFLGLYDGSEVPEEKVIPIKGKGQKAT
ncbi:arylsulfatase A-like enzyme [Maritalea mobilis]|uniref:Arylsulfatase A-like enzyme n=1 Tax=Maritalea mobilis TaxID=483324 RepID=A0A4R6VWR0_9HYPH|nr:alkaline phosphatase family protein [Maritalea mobilis]TDQ67194.1 arylsulfatase A-like enzyme [Maritalea mobilis]